MNLLALITLLLMKNRSLIIENNSARKICKQMYVFPFMTGHMGTHTHIHTQITYQKS